MICSSSFISLGLWMFLIYLLSFDVCSISVKHSDFKINGCSDTEKESMCGSNGDEIWHADFIQKMGVNTLPDFADPLLFPGFYESSVAEQETCQQNLAVCINAYKSPPEEMGMM